MVTWLVARFKKSGLKIDLLAGMSGTYVPIVQSEFDVDYETALEVFYSARSEYVTPTGAYEVWLNFMSITKESKHRLIFYFKTL